MLILIVMYREFLETSQKGKCLLLNIFCSTDRISVIAATANLVRSHDVHIVMESYLVSQSQPLDVALPC